LQPDRLPRPLRFPHCVRTCVCLRMVGKSLIAEKSLTRRERVPLMRSWAAGQG
jgi:hypothetical protein